MTEPAAAAAPHRSGARPLGAVLCTAGLALLCWPHLVTSAVGLELVAAAFWIWSRVAEDAHAQVSRWAWLRRPAQALWLAVAIHAALPTMGHAAMAEARGAFELLRWLESGAVVWAGLELLAALPLARPFSDLPGPLLAMRPWLPVMLPAAGFLVLWQHAEHWRDVAVVRGAASYLLLVTALLGTLRAFGRRQWAASLRWLMISDSAIAALMVATAAVKSEVSVLLWVGSCGGRAFLLAGELRGASPRRGPLQSGLWRIAAWTASAALAWPALLVLGFERGRFDPLLFSVASVPVALTAWVTVGRLVEAPERRRMTRLDASASLGHVAALLTLALGPLALVIAWWGGFEAAWPGSVVAMLPATLGGVGAWLRSRGLGVAGEIAAPADAGTGAADGTPRSPARGGAAASRAVARGTFHLVIAVERRLVLFVGGLGRALVSPIRDLHTGDAQEYLLLVVGIAVLALVLPLLQ
ncbi:MAG: hypothetical protein A2W00_02360 [Candidatus Eisenbacteria bacterium RBG_16_71_46]|nr:MAG: hypothetical protein A2W00_02360 [Candidatus Eisenbacteria bacterium RBG_16_71_46]